MQGGYLLTGQRRAQQDLGRHHHRHHHRRRRHCCRRRHPRPRPQCCVPRQPRWGGGVPILEERRDPSPLEEQGLGRDPFPLATRGLGLPSSQFREPAALKRARIITAPLGCVDWSSSLSDDSEPSPSLSDEPSLSSKSSGEFSTRSLNRDCGSLGFLTAVSNGGETRAGSTTPSGTQTAAPAESFAEGPCRLLSRWRPPPASAHGAIQEKNGQADQRQLCSVNAH